ncbi:DUF6221 family protein [Streptomyces tsukubensis]|uniref:DUF6221 family protein n=1 Tax=Streptomyces tsukubensis TaxID=83656 RepID=UPI00344B4332
MDDLIAFLNARLKEDEEAARDSIATTGQWRDLGDAVLLDAGPDITGLDLNVAEHIACWDPARVLREVDAKRQMVDASPVDCPPACRSEHTFSGSCSLRALGPAPARPPFTSESTLRLLALPYADHPDYKSEWRP